MQAIEFGFPCVMFGEARFLHEQLPGGGQALQRLLDHLVAVLPRHFFGLQFAVEVRELRRVRLRIAAVNILLRLGVFEARLRALNRVH